MFCDAGFVASDEYAAFWQKLGGANISAACSAARARGRDVWIRATYNPVLDLDGQVAKIVKFATDITESHELAIEQAEKIAAINRSQGAIEFDLSGNIIWANENFLNVTGYRLDEIQGRHHRCSVTQKRSESPEYANFWDNLARGEHVSGEFHRLAQGRRGPVDPGQLQPHHGRRWQTGEDLQDRIGHHPPRRPPNIRPRSLRSAARWR
jgi:methyl-accepting chemotaxis protein